MTSVKMGKKLDFSGLILESNIDEGSHGGRAIEMIFTFANITIDKRMAVLLKQVKEMPATSTRNWMKPMWRAGQQ